MSGERNDADAAAQEFLAMFETADRTVRDQSTKIFLSAFLKAYRAEKKEILAYSQSSSNLIQSPTKRTMGALGLNSSTYSLLEIVKSEKTDKLEKAQTLGTVLGKILAVIEYAIPSPNFNSQIAPDLEYSCKVMAKTLRDLGKGVKHGFIARRVQKIAKEHAGKLNAEKRKLIANIAAIFAA